MDHSSGQIAATKGALVNCEVTLAFGMLSTTILSPHMDPDEVQVEDRALDYSVAVAHERDKSNRNDKDCSLASFSYLIPWNQSLKNKRKDRLR